MSAAEILIVEDNPDDLEMTLHALRAGRFTHRIAVARDGAEAVDFLFCRGGFQTRCTDEVPKLILLDLKLPKLDGREVLGRIKADPRTQRIPVVMLTSSQEQKDIESGYGLGVNSYIVKPLRFEQFAAAVQQIGSYWLQLNQPPVPLPHE